MSNEGMDLSSGLLPTPEQAEAFFGGRMTPLSPPMRHPMDPPPLPPKPKTYPKHVSKWTPASSSDDERNSTTIVWTFYVTLFILDRVRF